MPHTVVEDFGRGLDGRRLAVSLPAGALATCDNAHINSGGEVEKALAWVPTYMLPPDTHAMATIGDQLYVFGSIETPTMPSGVVYQRLQSASLAMVRVHKVEPFDGKPYVAAEFSDGSIHHYFDGTEVSQWVDGRARGGFTVLSGTNSAGVNKITSVKVNGVEILNTAVDWATSHVATAAALAAQINSYTSSPDYAATSSGASLVIIADAGTGKTPNGYTVEVTVAGNVTVTTPTAMGGGEAGTFNPGKYALTLKNKMYSVSASILNYSKVGDPTIVQPADDGAEGAGFINMSNNAAGSEQLTALGIFFGQLAIFSRKVIQIWAVEADDDNNVQLQVLYNTGTDAPRTVLQVNENDLLYLSRSGLRSLKSRDSSNAAYASDLGSAIDPLLRAARRIYGAAIASQAVSIFEPNEGRLFLAFGQDVWVYSFFPGGKVAAWSKYRPGFQITDFAVIEEALYARAGDTIYRLGGTTGEEYAATTTTLILPWLSAKRPDDDKLAVAVNIVAAGTWKIYLNTNPRSPTAFKPIATVEGVTAPLMTIPLDGESTHFQLKLVNERAEKAIVGAVSLEFEPTGMAA